MANLTDEEISDIHAFAIQLGKDAGNMLMDAVRHRISPRPDDGRTETGAEYVDKENAVDIVTKTDTGMRPILSR